MKDNYSFSSFVKFIIFSQLFGFYSFLIDFHLGFHRVLDLFWLFRLMRWNLWVFLFIVWFLGPLKCLAFYRFDISYLLTQINNHYRCFYDGFIFLIGARMSVCRVGRTCFGLGAHCRYFLLLFFRLLDKCYLKGLFHLKRMKCALELLRKCPGRRNSGLLCKRGNVWG